MSRHFQDVDKLIKIHRPHQVKKQLPEREPKVVAPEPKPPLPSANRLHNERHKLIAAGLRAGVGFERSALAAAAFMRAKYGFVPIRDGEGFYLCEIGLTNRERE